MYIGVSWCETLWLFFAVKEKHWKHETVIISQLSIVQCCSYGGGDL